MERDERLGAVRQLHSSIQTRSGLTSSSGATTGLVRVPTPAISTSTRSPGRK